MVLTLAVSAASLASASVLGQGHAHRPTKRSSGTVAGAEAGTFYTWSSDGTTAQCPDLPTADLETSLDQFDGIFPRLYNDGTPGGGNVSGYGALYLSYPDAGTFSFYLIYTSVTPNTTATWVDTGADISNVWTAIKEDVYDVWGHNNTFQWATYQISKTIDGSSNHAGQLQINIQTPTFVKGCGTACGGGCDPNICDC
ncbi:hypothetical protein KVR01_013082 [Diaporthe batatas]|uniref:uncharacterized protein n=1 Tax=Diaporthe batatas TaxID=748121 RepID=UPI001D0491DC|nr:uncharacterized protein KVR01_013082 [Diaporthe batatas]KAG8157092.1 hypothetical protein KVR01_013082 [Diaporthe batatas]